jgi:hypothetical protein
MRLDRGDAVETLTSLQRDPIGHHQPRLVDRRSATQLPRNALDPLDLARRDISRRHCEFHLLLQAGVFVRNSRFRATLRVTSRDGVGKRQSSAFIFQNTGQHDPVAQSGA